MPDKLKAEETTLFVDRPDQTKRTTVKYSGTEPIALWLRVDEDTWVKQNLIEDAGSSVEAAQLELDGERLTPLLKAGQIAEFGITLASSSTNPTAAGFHLSSFSAYVIIEVLLKQCRRQSRPALGCK